VGLGAVRAFRVNVTGLDLPLIGADAAEKELQVVHQNVGRFCCAWFASQCCRGLILGGLLYVFLGLLSLMTTPFPACVTLAALVTDQPCECSCAVAFEGAPDVPFYHPGGPGHLEHADSLALTAHATQYSTVRGVLGSYRYLCGVCPVTSRGAAFGDCTARAEAQLGAQPPTGRWRNATQALACYLPECARATAAYFERAEDELYVFDRMPDACERRREVALAPGVDAACRTSRIAPDPDWGAGRWVPGGGCN
jgi:hypothetical protein